MNMHKGFATLPILIVLTAAVVATTGYFMFAGKKLVDKSGDTVACTQEAMQCSDGSFVGRTGPHCEFLCPGVTTTTTTTTGTTSLKEQDTIDVPTITASPAPTAITTSDWQPYINTRYLFGFKYPESHTPYVAVDKEMELLIPADVTSEVVHVAEKESSLFCCEPVVLSFSIIEEDASLSDWVGSNSQRYISDSNVLSEKVIAFEGKPAIEILGPGNMEAIRKLIVVKPGNYFVVITQSASTDFLDAVLKTFTFNVQGLR